MPSSSLILVLVAGMLLTGSSNTLLTKYQDQLCVRNCDDPNPSNREKFEQPVIQTLQMFIGEMGCWILVGLFSLFDAWNERRKHGAGYEPVTTNDNSEAVAGEEDGEVPDPETRPLRQRRPSVKAMVSNHPEHPELRGARVLLLALPSICDICGTTLMNVGLLFVAASIYQMTRGALVLFVGLFSILFLKRHLYAFQWFALFVVVLGVAVVGLSGALYHQDETEAQQKVVALATDDAVLRSVVGVLLIAGAQVFTATQFVLEEHILEKYALAPLKVVGWEGVFGFSVTVIGMFILHLIIGQTEAGRYGYFDAKEGLRELAQPDVALSSFLIMISIGAFNFFGISVTRSVSATARSVIDTSRTLVIWIISLSLGWEKFTFLQLGGFALLVYGTFLFNQVIQPPLKACMPRVTPDPIIEEDVIEHL